MPQYKQNQYGQFQYGKYTLHTKNSSLDISEAVRLRLLSSPIRIRTDHLKKEGQPNRLRMRALDGPWVESEKIEIKGERFRVRMRVLNEQAPWVESIRYRIKGE